MKINYHRENESYKGKLYDDDIWELTFRSFALKLFFKPVRIWDWHYSVDTWALDDQYDDNGWHLKNPLWGFTERFFWLPTMAILVKPTKVKVID